MPGDRDSAHYGAASRDCQLFLNTRMREWMNLVEELQPAARPNFFDRPAWWLKLYGKLGKALLRSIRSKSELANIDYHMHANLARIMHQWRTFASYRGSPATTASVMKFLDDRYATEVTNFVRRYLDEHQAEYNGKLTAESAGKLLGAAVFAIFLPEYEKVAAPPPDLNTWGSTGR